MDQRQKILSDQANSALHVYGVDVPVEIKTKLGSEFATLSKEYDAFRARASEFAKKKAARIRAALERLKSANSAGEADPQDVRLAVSATGFRVQDVLRGEDGSPSRLEAALQKAAQGISDGDMDSAVEAANFLLRPQLSNGIGTNGQDGTPIVSKEIVRFVPHPDDPKKVSPVLLVRTVGNPQGYVAPATERRSADKDDLPKWIDIDDLMEHGAKIGQLVQLVNDPEIAPKIKSSPASDQDREIDPALMFAMIPGIKPEAIKQKASTERAEIRAEATKAAAQQRASAQVASAGIRSAASKTVASGGSGGQKPRFMTGKMLDTLVEGEAANYGLVKERGQWMQKDASGRTIPASADSLQVLARIKSDVVSRAAQGMVGAPIPALPQSVQEAMVDQVYRAPDGRFVRYIGEGKFEVLGRGGP